MIDEINEKQRDMMLHAFGLSRLKESYRNYYNTRGDDPNWLDLVRRGLAIGPCNINIGIYPPEVGNFYLTPLGCIITYEIGGRLNSKKGD